MKTPHINLGHIIWDQWGTPWRVVDKRSEGRLFVATGVHDALTRTVRVVDPEPVERLPGAWDATLKDA